MKRGTKIGSALILVAALALPITVLPGVYAAVGVKTEEKCAVEVNVTGCSFKELNGTDAEVKSYPVTIDLYKVADIGVNGTYKVIDSLETLDLSGVGSETTAEEWAEFAATAKAEVDADEMAPTASEVTADGVAAFADLATGMYLVDAKQVLSDYYQYDFIPYLISLPNNYYYDTDSTDDTWVYALTGEKAIGVKPEKSDRYGDLNINKDLDVYNATNGGANFVFQIEGTKTDVDTGEVKVVYSDVVSMTFENPGTETVTIQDIPAGSEITVTEVYSGANYTLTSDAAQTVTILADPVENGNPEAEGPVDVFFANTHDGGLNGGTGLVNNFTYDSENNTWLHEATEDSAN